MISYAFTRRPRWIVLHVLMLLGVSLFCVAGFWQLDRLEQRRAHNALVEERRAMPPLTSLDESDLEQRRVRLEGRYDTAQLRLTGRSFRGTPGDHLLTPLVIGDANAVLIDRGWVPPDERMRPPRGTVTVEGIVLPSERGGGPSTDDRVSRINLDLLRERFPDLELAPVYVLLQEQTPDAPGPRPAEPAELTEGSHLSYAVQWFSFIPTALIVYVLLLRREARKRRDAVSSGPD